MSPPADVRKQEYEEAQIIRQVVAKHLGQPIAQITNWTKLGDKANDIYAELSHTLGKPLSAGTTLTADTDVVALISAFRGSR